MFKLLRKRSENPIRPNEVSATKEFLEFVDRCMTEKLESALKSMTKKMKMDDNVIPVTIPKVAEFKEFDQQTKMLLADITKIHSDDSINHVMLLGDTGSGKTMFALNYALMALKNELDVSKEIKLVYFFDVSNCQILEKFSAFNLLFVRQLGSKLPDHLHCIGKEWLKQYSEHVLLVVDGLDQSLQSFTGKYPEIEIESPEKANIIIANILSGHIYPGMKILSTSCWQLYWKLDPGLKATKTLALLGLDKESMYSIAEKIFGLEGKGIIDNEIQKDFMLNPMLFYFMIVLLRNSEKGKVDSSTNLIVLVLKYFLRSCKMYAEELILKLIKLALYGMIDNRYVFTASYLKSFDLNIDDLRNLVEVDSETRFIEYVDDDEVKVRFCQQSVQQILASLFICNLDLADFTKYVESYYNESQMQVVIKQVFGIILNQSTSRCLEEFGLDNLDIGMKSEYLMSFLEKILEGNVLSDIHVMMLLYECGSEVIKKVCSHIVNMEVKVKLEFGYLQPEKQHAILSVARHIETIRVLSLWDLKIHPGNYSSFLFVLGSIRYINIDFFHLINWDHTSEKLQVLTEAMLRVNMKIGWFFLRESASLEPASYHHIITMVHHSGAGGFTIDNCDLNAEKIGKMSDAAVTFSLRADSYDIDGNSNMNIEAFQESAKLLKILEATSQYARFCTPTMEHLKDLCNSLENVNIKLFNLTLQRSTTEPLTNNELLVVSRLIQRVKRFSFYDQVLNKSQWKTLGKYLKKHCPKAEIKCNSSDLVIYNPDVLIK